MRPLLLSSGFIAGALAGFMAEIGIVSLIGLSSTVTIDMKLWLVPILPAAIGVCGAILLLAIVHRTCGPAPSLLALINALASVALITLAMVAALALVANPFDQSPTSAAREVIYGACMLGPVAAMLIVGGALRRRSA